jgi:hypothetical protein
MVRCCSGPLLAFEVMPPHVASSMHAYESVSSPHEGYQLSVFVVKASKLHKLLLDHKKIPQHP